MTLGEKLRDLRKREGLSANQLAQIFGLSTSYISDIEKGRAKGTGGKFWDAVRMNRPGWEAILRDRGPRVRVESVDERRFFNKEAGLSEEDSNALEVWLKEHEKVRDLLVGWARARRGGTLPKLDTTNLVEVVIEAVESYLLENLKDTGEKIPEG